MATVKVKLRPSRVKGKAGVVFYQITHKRETRYITSHIRLLPPDWESCKGEIAAAAANRPLLQNRINSDLTLLRRIIADLDIGGADYSATDVVNRYQSPDQQILVVDYMRTLIGQLKAANRLGSARNYEKAMRSFSQFAGQVRLPLSAISGQLIAEYNAFLVQKGLVRNSISFYMRILRAVYNKAVRQKIIEQAQPFAEVYTGIDRTRKRAVPESVIAQLHRLDLPAPSALALARDLFVFSYCTRGMAFVDMAYLRRSNLQNGNICYSRRKTGQLLTIKIEPGIQQIIDRYSTPERPYVFPIISSNQVATAYKQYQAALNTYNRLLGRLSTQLGCESKLTSYTARHSWATAARNHNVPISVISAGMGHSSEQTTQIYLTMLENTVIDEANRGIIQSLFK